jgi:RHS repeat-associated protein
VDKAHYLQLLAQDSTWLQRKRERYDIQSSRDQISLKRYDSTKELLLSVEELLGEGKAKSGSNGVPFYYLPAEHDIRLPEVTYYLHDHLGNMRVTYSIPCAGGAPVPTLLHAADYYPYGAILREFVNSGGPEKYLTTHHERDVETGLDYRGARYYDSDVARFLSVDALAGLAPSWTPYRYAFNNPISYSDPTGNFESTHTDKDGNVVAVYNDGDNGVYKHDDLSSWDQKSTLSRSGSGVSHMGETKYWDEFGGHAGKTRILFGQSWEPVLDEAVRGGSPGGLIPISRELRGGGDLDLKARAGLAGTGRLLEGKYASVRSAGNYLAGYFAGLMGAEFETFQKLAGALHVQESRGQQLTYDQKVEIVMTGKAYGPAPEYGEIPYQYRMSRSGFDAGKSQRYKLTPYEPGPKY